MHFFCRTYAYDNGMYEASTDSHIHVKKHLPWGLFFHKHNSELPCLLCFDTFEHDTVLKFSLYIWCITIYVYIYVHSVLGWQSQDRKMIQLWLYMYVVEYCQADMVDSCQYNRRRFPLCNIQLWNHLSLPLYLYIYIYIYIYIWFFCWRAEGEV